MSFFGPQHLMFISNAAHKKSCPSKCLSSPQNNPLECVNLCDVYSLLLFYTARTTDKFNDLSLSTLLPLCVCVCVYFVQVSTYHFRVISFLSRITTFDSVQIKSTNNKKISTRLKVKINKNFVFLHFTSDYCSVKKKFFYYYHHHTFMMIYFYVFCVDSYKSIKFSPLFVLSWPFICLHFCAHAKYL